MSNRTLIEEGVERGVERLRGLPPEEWGDWLVAVLEELEPAMQAEGQGEAFEAMLHKLQHYLERRLLRDMREQ